MKNLVQKDKKKRNFIYSYDNFRFILKNIILNKKLYTTIRWNTILRLSNLPKNSSKIISSNRCIITGRKHGINKKFRLSRIALLKLSRSGQISGIKKSV